MAVAQYTKTVLANIPPLYDITLEIFYEKMLVQTPAMDRFKFLATIIDEQSYFLPPINWSNGKSDEKSNEFRCVGNECFKRLEYVEALKWYNKALCHAKSKTNIGICYANRSAVYYELSMFTICLKNIEAAQKCVFSERLEEKLSLRQTKAQYALLARSYIPPKENILELKRPANKSQPFFVNCLSKHNESIITSQVLYAGDVVSSEKPYCRILNQSHIYERCTYCLTNKNYLSMISCRNCSSAMFCNETCREMADKMFHRYECSIIDGLFHFLSESMYLGLRAVFTSLYECNGSMDEYFNRMMKCFENDSDPFDVDITQDNHNNEKLFEIIFNLTRSFDFSMVQHVATVVIAEKLKSKFDWLFDCNALIAEMLSVSIFQMLEISQENGIPLEEIAFSGYGDVGNDLNVYGRGLFPFASSFKISCAPNVLLLNDNGTLVGFALRTIHANEAIVPGIMSRNHFLTDKHRRNERTRAFSGQWCHCVACERNYDLYSDIQRLPPPFGSHRQPIPLISEKRMAVEDIASTVQQVVRYLHSSNASDVSWEVGLCAETITRLVRQLVQAYGTDLVFTEYSNFVRNC